MNRITLTAAALALSPACVAQPRLTIDYPAMAARIVQQLALKPGERVMSLAHPGVFDDLLPYIRCEVMRAGGAGPAAGGPDQRGVQARRELPHVWHGALTPA